MKREPQDAQLRHRGDGGERGCFQLGQSLELAVLTAESKGQTSSRVTAVAIGKS